MKRERSNPLSPSGVRVYVTLASVCDGGNVLHTSEGDVHLASESVGVIDSLDEESFVSGFLDEKGFHIVKVLHFEDYPPTEFLAGTSQQLLLQFRKK